MPARTVRPLPRRFQPGQEFRTAAGRPDPERPARDNQNRDIAGKNPARGRNPSSCRDRSGNRLRHNNSAGPAMSSSATVRREIARWGQWRANGVGSNRCKRTRASTRSPIRLDPSLSLAIVLQKIGASFLRRPTDTLSSEGTLARVWRRSGPLQEVREFFSRLDDFEGGMKTVVSDSPRCVTLRRRLAERSSYLVQASRHPRVTGAFRHCVFRLLKFLSPI